MELYHTDFKRKFCHTNAGVLMDKNNGNLTSLFGIFHFNICCHSLPIMIGVSLEQMNGDHSQMHVVLMSDASSNDLTFFVWQNYGLAIVLTHGRTSAVDIHLNLYKSSDFSNAAKHSNSTYIYPSLLICKETMLHESDKYNFIIYSVWQTNQPNISAVLTEYGVLTILSPLRTSPVKKSIQIHMMNTSFISKLKPYRISNARELCQLHRKTIHYNYLILKK